MPYYIEKDNTKCKSGWAVTGATGVVHGCHTTKASAIKQAVAISLSTDEPFAGERAAVGELSIGDYVTWDEENPMALGEVEMVVNTLAAIRIYEQDNGVFSPTEDLVITNIMKLKRIPRPDMVAEKISDEEPNTAPSSDLPDNYRPALAKDVPEGRACGNCYFYDESRVNEAGDKAWCEQWDAFVDGSYYCNSWQPAEEGRAAPDALSVGDFVSWNSSGGRASGRIVRIVRNGQINVPNSSFTITGTQDDPAALIALYRENADGYQETPTRVGHKFSTLTKIDSLERSESRAVNLAPPAFMRAAARRGLVLYEQGKGGDGLVDATIREARAMAAGNVTADKWVRIAAWIARHMPDLDAPQNSNSSDPNYPGPGLVAHLLWGSGPSKRRAQRTMAYAERIVARLEAESARGNNMLTKEQRINTANFEVRQTGNGMTFSGYAAIFDSPSEPLPFIERIAAGAFRKTLQSRNEIKLLWNHDSSQILGSLRAGTLRVTEDAYGLKVEADLPDTQLGRDTATLLRRGDVNAMSFGFSVPKGGDTWSVDGTERTLKSVRLFEVSIVGSPAYTATAGTATVRSFDKLALRSQVDEDTLSDVMLKLEEGQDLTEEEAAIISEAVNALTPKIEQEVVAEEPTIEQLESNLLELKRKQLELIKKKVL
jgi:HK97 family phage prohead protease